MTGTRRLDVVDSTPSFMDADHLLDWLRVIVLFFCMGFAARSDYSTLRVSDRHWLNWTAPATALLIAEMTLLGTSASNYYMVATLLAAASIPLFDPPNLVEAKRWGSNEVTLASIYLVAAVGLLGGALENANTDFVALVLGNESPEISLWWSMLAALVTMILYLSAWRIGLIQGGADAKALVLITLLLPSWAFLPEPLFAPDDALFNLPPSMVMFLWASLVFMLAPPVLIFQNAMNGSIESWADLKMAWHAIKRPLSEIGDKPVWLLTEAIHDDELDDFRIVNRVLPGSTTPSVDEISQRLAELEMRGVESAWIATKHPFVAYLFLSIVPLLLLGDPLGVLAKSF
tara:strand:- start:15927 stop:16961 length:1035 start_codon:yes stop_codon:yes gene_type:complete